MLAYRHIKWGFFSKLLKRALFDSNHNQACFNLFPARVCVYVLALFCLIKKKPGLDSAELDWLRLDGEGPAAAAAAFLALPKPPGVKVTKLRLSIFVVSLLHTLGRCYSNHESR